MQVTAVFPRVMIGTWLFSDDVCDTLYTSTSVTIDPDDYGGIDKIKHAYFEVVIDTNTAYGIQLVVRATREVLASFPDPEQVLTNYTRLKVEFTLKPVTTTYCCLIPQDPDGGVDTRHAQILLEVEESNEVLIEVPMLLGDESSGGFLNEEDLNDFWAWGNHTESLVYDHPYVEACNNIWRYTAENYRVLDYIKINVIMCNFSNEWDVYEPTASCQGPCYAALFDRTTGIMVPGSELTFTEFFPAMKTSAELDASLFTDGHDYEIRYKVTDAGTIPYAVLYRAELLIKIEDVRKIEIYNLVGSIIDAHTQGHTDVTTEVRYLHTPELLQDGTLFYYELVVNGVRVRSADITSVLVQGNRYIVTWDVYPGVWTGMFGIASTDIADTGQFAFVGYGNAVAVISNGNLSDPPDIVLPQFTGWVTPASVLNPPGGSDARIQLNMPNDKATIRVTDFEWPTMPADFVSTYLNVFMCCLFQGPPYWVTTYQSVNLGGGAYIPGYVDVNGHAELLDNKEVNWDMYYPQNSYPQPVPGSFPNQGGWWTLTGDQPSWTKTQLENLILDIEPRVPAAAAPKRFLQWGLKQLILYAGGLSATTEVEVTEIRRHFAPFIIALIEGEEEESNTCVFSFEAP